MSEMSYDKALNLEATGPEQRKFMAWFEAERKKGLVDIKLFRNPEAAPTNDREAIYAELNRMNEAIAKGEGRTWIEGDSKVNRQDVF